MLPGLGSFTVVDGASVSVADLGNNFFVTAADLGRPRAEVRAELHLQLLNENTSIKVALHFCSILLILILFVHRRWFATSSWK